MGRRGGNQENRVQAPPSTKPARKLPAPGGAAPEGASGHEGTARLRRECQALLSCDSSRGQGPMDSPRVSRGRGRAHMCARTCTHTHHGIHSWAQARAVCGGARSLRSYCVPDTTCQVLSAHLAAHAHAVTNHCRGLAGPPSLEPARIHDSGRAVCPAAPGVARQWSWALSVAALSRNVTHVTS